MSKSFTMTAKFSRAHRLNFIVYKLKDTNFLKFPKKEKSLELANMIFEDSSLKGIFGQNMSDPPKWSLTDDSILDSDRQPFKFMITAS